MTERHITYVVRLVPYLARVGFACGHESLVRAESYGDAPRVGGVGVCWQCSAGGLEQAPTRSTTELQDREEGRRRSLGEEFRDGLEGPGVESAESLRSAMAEVNARRRAEGTIGYRTRDHPLAVGRTPGSGDQRTFAYRFPLEDGRSLIVEMGAEGRAILERLFLAEMVEHAVGSHDDQEDRR